LSGASLSLDFARTVRDGPAGFSLFGWWATLERTFLGFPDLKPGRGRVFLSQGSLSAELRYRLEDGATIALYDVVRSGPSSASS
jgi:hypothetical protein